MSRTAMFWAQEHPAFKTLPPSARLVLVCGLAYRANEDGECWHHIDDVIGLTGLSRSGVKLAFEAIREAGIVASLREGIGRGSTLRWVGFPGVPRKGSLSVGNGSLSVGKGSLSDPPIGTSKEPVKNRANGSLSDPFLRRDATFTTADGDTFIPGTGWVRR